jgi:hypothetical protein
MNPPGFLWLQADSSLAPHAQQFVASCYGKVDIACQATAGDCAAQGSIAAALLPEAGSNFRRARWPTSLARIAKQPDSLLRWACIIFGCVLHLTILALRSCR